MYHLQRELLQERTKVPVKGALAVAAGTLWDGKQRVMVVFRKKNTVKSGGRLRFCYFLFRFCFRKKDSAVFVKEMVGLKAWIFLWRFLKWSTKNTTIVIRTLL